jgi:hypothetical protein
MFTEDDDMDGLRCHAFLGGTRALRVLRERRGVKGFMERDQIADENLPAKTRNPCFADSGRRAKAIGALLLFLMPAMPLLAQETLRSYNRIPSVAGFRPGGGTFLRIGPFGGTLTGGAGVGFNDNYNATESHKITDWYTFQTLNFDLSWVISRLNRIDFTLGAALQEDFLSNGNSGVRLSVAPQSTLEFQFQVADFRITLFDNLSYTNDPITDPTVSGSGNLNRFSNAAGATVEWLLHNATVSLGFLWTYTNQSTSGSIAANTSSSVRAVSGERNDYRIPAALIFNFSPTVFYGVDTTAIKSTAPGFSDANAVNVGAFVRGYLTRLVDVDFHAGVYYIDAGSVPPVDWDLSVSIRDQINRSLQAYLSFVRDISFGVGNQLSDLNSFYFGAAYNLTRHWTISSQPFVNFGHTFGFGGEHFTQYGFQVGSDLKLSKRWTGSITYRLVRRDSNLLNRSYTQNQVSCSINYAF